MTRVLGLVFILSPFLVALNVIAGLPAWSAFLSGAMLGLGCGMFVDGKR